MDHGNMYDSSNIQEPFRVGAVSFFNARPLIYSLERNPAVQLTRVVPAQLPEALNAGALHTGMVPSIDYQHNGNDWLILPVAAIASDGPVLTVQIFSRQPLEKIHTLACDPDSHTSVVLAQILWQLKFRRSLEITPLPSQLDAAEAVLLIGDKVIPQLNRWPYQLDLGQAWTDLTQLPFVYAFWAVPAELNNACEPLVQILRQAYQQGVENLDTIIESCAAEHGFDKKLAREYFTRNINFDFGPLQHQGLKKFYELAHQFGFTNQNQPLRVYPKERAGSASDRSPPVEQ
jgi:chorismate dehydratase